MRSKLTTLSQGMSGWSRIYATDALQKLAEGLHLLVSVAHLPQQISIPRLVPCYVTSNFNVFNTLLATDCSASEDIAKWRKISFTHSQILGNAPGGTLIGLPTTAPSQSIHTVSRTHDDEDVDDRDEDDDDDEISDEGVSLADSPAIFCSTRSFTSFQLEPAFCASSSAAGSTVSMSCCSPGGCPLSSKFGQGPFCLLSPRAEHPATDKKTVPDWPIISLMLLPFTITARGTAHSKTCRTSAWK